MFKSFWNSSQGETKNYNTRFFLAVTEQGVRTFNDDEKPLQQAVRRLRGVVTAAQGAYDRNIMDLLSGLYTAAEFTGPAKTWYVSWQEIRAAWRVYASLRSNRDTSLRREAELALARALKDLASQQF